MKTSVLCYYWLDDSTRKNWFSGERGMKQVSVQILVQWFHKLQLLAITTIVYPKSVTNSKVLLSLNNIFDLWHGQIKQSIKFIVAMKIKFTEHHMLYYGNKIKTIQVRRLALVCVKLNIQVATTYKIKTKILNHT